MLNPASDTSSIARAAVAARPAAPMARRAPAARARGPRFVLRAGGLALVGFVLGGRFLLGGLTPAPVAHVSEAPASAIPVTQAAPGASAASAPGAPAASAPAPSGAPAQAASGDLGLGAGSALPRLDVGDIVMKAVFVIALLIVTLRVLRRMQAGPRQSSARLTVLECRSVAHKGQVVLVSVGPRRLVVGVTPTGMTTLADIAAEDLDEPAPANAVAPADAASGAAAAAPAAPGSPARPASSIADVLGLRGLPGASVLASLSGFVSRLVPSRDHAA
jgi:flagellar biosynthetic protein FliO